MRRDFQSMVGTWGAGIQGCGLIPSASARNRSAIIKMDGNSLEVRLYGSYASFKPKKDES